MYTLAHTRPTPRHDRPQILVSTHLYIFEIALYTSLLLSTHPPSTHTHLHSKHTPTTCRTPPPTTHHLLHTTTRFLNTPQQHPHQPFFVDRHARCKIHAKSTQKLLRDTSGAVYVKTGSQMSSMGQIHFFKICRKTLGAGRATFKFAPSIIPPPKSSCPRLLPHCTRTSCCHPST
jgi:hypothetical protein